jgi:cytochrome c biogenesis protein CcmG, thiol:disulfide interchange protein DsbE
MIKTVQRLILVAVAIGVVGLVTWGILSPKKATVAVPPATPSKVVGLQVGSVAPDFTLLTSDGKQVHLRDYRGLPVVLLFSSKDCTSCLMQVSDVQKLYSSQQAAHKAFALMGIDIEDKASSTMQYDQQTGIASPLLLTQTSSVGELYQVRATPTSFFIDRKGIIRAVIEGEMDTTTLQRQVAQVSA